MASWKEIRNYQMTAQIAQAADEFRREQENERRRPPADVFISYSSLDREAARQLSRRLTEAGVDYFLDEKDIRAGDELSSRLEEEIRKRHYYLLLLSKHSAASQWVIYEWALAKGAGCDVRMLRLEPDAPIPGPLAAWVAGSDMEQEIAHFAAGRYSRLALQVLLRDVFRPYSPETVVRFLPVDGQAATWEHPDAPTWAEKDRELALLRQFDLAGEPRPRIARFEVHADSQAPKLVLHCERSSPFDLAIAPEGHMLHLTRWWDTGEAAVAIVHPAFWRAAVEELLALMNGRATLVQRNGTSVNNLFPVTWA
jgi:hypothetical protein